MSKTPPTASGQSSPSDEIRGIQFETADTGVTVVDQIERKREHFGTSPAVEPVPVSANRLVAPVDRAVRLDADRVETTERRIAMVRDDEFEMIDHLTDGDRVEYGPGRYVVDVSGAIKCYLQVDGSLSVESGDRTVVSIGPGSEAMLGARSLHTRPTTEVTVPATTDGLIRAISTFGAAVKTTSPDRSWPTLRGHPPAVSVGGELDVPQGLEPPSPEVQVLVPPEERYLYTVAPLMYYLGAELVPHSGTPQIRTDAGFEYDLGRGAGFEVTTERTLKQILTLECFLRSEGMIELPLHERDLIAERVPFDPAELFDQPPEVRLPAYLSVEYDAVADYVPDWELAAHLAPRPDQAELLPYLVDDLAVVRTRPESTAGVDPSELARPDPVAPGAPEEDLVDDANVQEFFRSGTSVGNGWTVENSVDLRDAETGALETVWGGDGVPVGASKATKGAYNNRLTRQPDPPPIDIGVVCNDDGMADELDVTELYDDEGMPMNVETYRNLSRAALQTLIEFGDLNFLHYIGHADPEGLYCSDGKLSLSDVEETDVESFLLNACQSFDQGLAMLDAGAIGGVVTLQDIPIRSAINVGKQMARMLNVGYPLRVATNVVDEASRIGGQYQIVGDGAHVIAQRDGASASVRYLAPVDGDLTNATTFEFWTHSHPAENSIGGVYNPRGDEFGHTLVGNTTPKVSFGRERLVDFLHDDQCPVIVTGPDDGDDSMLWSTEIISALDEQ